MGMGTETPDEDGGLANGRRNDYRFPAQSREERPCGVELVVFPIPPLERRGWSSLAGMTIKFPRTAFSPLYMTDLTLARTHLT